MGFKFESNDMESISAIFGAEPTQHENTYTWKIRNQTTNQAISLNIHNNAGLGIDSKGSLISVQTQHGYFELHDCSCYMVFEPDEIIFIQATDYRVSSLIVGRECSCSMYANINRSILSADFTKLDPAVLLSAMQLSITEILLT